jgi:hypothetical protein
VIKYVPNFRPKYTKKAGDSPIVTASNTVAHEEAVDLIRQNLEIDHRTEAQPNQLSKEVERAEASIRHIT